MNSKTPRTDAEARSGAYMQPGDYSTTQGKQFVHIDFARQLETELNEALKMQKYRTAERDAALKDRAAAVRWRRWRSMR